MTIQSSTQLSIQLEQLNENACVLDGHCTFMEEMVLDAYDGVITLLIELRQRVDPRMNNGPELSPAQVEGQLASIISLLALVNQDCTTRVRTMDELIKEQTVKAKWLQKELTPAEQEAQS